MAILVTRCRFLEAVAGTNDDAASGEAFVAQQRAFIDAILLYFFLGDVDGFEPYVELIRHIVVHAGIELPSVIVNNRETPWRAGRTDVVV